MTDRTGLDDALYVWQSTGPVAGRYRVHVNGIGTSPVLALGQGFFVHVTKPNQPGRLTLRDAYRLTTPANSPVLRPLADSRPQLHLVLSGTEGADTRYVYFEAGASAGIIPAYDAVKRRNPGNLNLATLAGDTALAINGLPPLVATTLVPIQLAVPNAGNYTLQVAKLVNFAPGSALNLFDAQLSKSTPLTQGTTTSFTITDTGLSNRFTP